jgi:hypothetical protein
MRIVGILTALTMCLFASTASQAQCLQSLLQDRAKFNLRDASSLATMRLIQQGSSQQSGWSATVPFVGDVGVGERESAVSNYFDRSSLDWTHERLVSLATQTLSKNAVDAFRICTEGSKNNGVTISVHDARPDAVTVSVKWSAPPYAPSIQRGSITVTGGQLKNAFPSKWVSGSVHSNIIERSSEEDLRIIANIGGDTDSAFVAYLPKVDDPPPVLPIALMPLYVGTTAGVNLGEITSNPAHINGATIAWGWSIASGPQSGEGLFKGETPDRNASMITTNQGLWRSGQTSPYGFAMKADDEHAAKDLPLYVGVGGQCDGEVANNPSFQGCNMQLIGYAYKPLR